MDGLCVVLVVPQVRDTRIRQVAPGDPIDPPMSRRRFVVELLRGDQAIVYQLSKRVCSRLERVNAADFFGCEHALPAFDCAE